VKYSGGIYIVYLKTRRGERFSEFFGVFWRFSPVLLHDRELENGQGKRTGGQYGGRYETGSGTNGE